MFIKTIVILNFRLFKSNEPFRIDDINIPDGNNDGSGLTVFAGENGCGKTSILDAVAYSLLPYKADGFKLTDLNNLEEKFKIAVLSGDTFKVAGTMPKSFFLAKGFEFIGGLRSRKGSFLSSVLVKDLKYIRADGVDKPADSSPDLRVSVNNPFSGKRFDENNILFLEKNRTSQIRSGIYNQTRFDRLMEDFNYQHIKLKKDKLVDINSQVKSEIMGDIKNAFMEKALEEFKNISGHEINLSLLDNWMPFERAYFSEQREQLTQIPPSQLGSGYEMIFTFLYSFYLAKQSNKQTIVLIDEPELHLHPKIQSRFLQFLLKASKDIQVILTSHSPLLIKQLEQNKNTKVFIMTKDNGHTKLGTMKKKALPYVSANEINYLAFDLVGEEYHNELYNQLKSIKGPNESIKEFDNKYFVSQLDEPKEHPWKTNPNEVSLHTFIRNQIHHPDDNGRPNIDQLEESIKKIYDLLQNILLKSANS